MHTFTTNNSLHQGRRARMTRLYMSNVIESSQPVRRRALPMPVYSSATGTSRRAHSASENADDL